MLSNSSFLTKQRIMTVVSLLFIVPVGFYSKFYTGPAADWANNSLGGFFYEIFWCLLIFLFSEKIKPWKIAGSVLLITCGLEFLQLWHPLFLEIPRSYFIGRTILGTTFSWSDFPYYFLGSAAGWLWMRLLNP
jgi:hypothetical protein